MFKKCQNSAKISGNNCCLRGPILTGGPTLAHGEGCLRTNQKFADSYILWACISWACISWACIPSVTGLTDVASVHHSRRLCRTPSAVRQTPAPPLGPTDHGGPRLHQLHRPEPPCRRQELSTILLHLNLFQPSLARTMASP
jgi:hypothetical protein